MTAAVRKLVIDLDLPAAAERLIHSGNENIPDLLRQFADFPEPGRHRRLAAVRHMAVQDVSGRIDHQNPLRQVAEHRLKLALGQLPVMKRRDIEQQDRDQKRHAENQFRAMDGNKVRRFIHKSGPGRQRCGVQPALPQRGIIEQRLVAAPQYRDASGRNSVQYPDGEVAGLTALLQPADHDAACGAVPDIAVELAEDHSRENPADARQNRVTVLRVLLLRGAPGVEQHQRLFRPRRQLPEHLLRGQAVAPQHANPRLRVRGETPLHKIHRQIVPVRRSAHDNDDRHTRRQQTEAVAEIVEQIPLRLHAGHVEFLLQLRRQFPMIGGGQERRPGRQRENSVEKQIRRSVVGRHHQVIAGRRELAPQRFDIGSGRRDARLIADPELVLLVIDPQPGPVQARPEAAAEFHRPDIRR